MRAPGAAADGLGCFNPNPTGLRVQKACLHEPRNAACSPATLMMLAPVWVTTPAISMLYQRAPLRIT